MTQIEISDYSGRRKSILEVGRYFREALNRRSPSRGAPNELDLEEVKVVRHPTLSKDRLSFERSFSLDERTLKAQQTSMKQMRGGGNNSENGWSFKKSLDCWFCGSWQKVFLV